MNYAGYLIVGLFGIGMGLAFLVADSEAPTSRSLALFWGIIRNPARVRGGLKGFSAPVPVFALRAVVLEERTA